MKFLFSLLLSIALVSTAQETESFIKNDFIGKWTLIESVDYDFNILRELKNENETLNLKEDNQFEWHTQSNILKGTWTYIQEENRIKLLKSNPLTESQIEMGKYFNMTEEELRTVSLSNVFIKESDLYFEVADEEFGPHLVRYSIANSR